MDPQPNQRPLPDTAKEKPQRGKVLAVGPGTPRDNGECTPPSVQIGDLVLYARYAGCLVEVDGKEVVILREEDILGILEQP